ncbi:hypothetical protein PLICRDRAFT_611906 [Plicaturopsis crispa FD-325 SS-3]|nr:hypothetical protein PLICRDRAFT_611906 [Plicaturopsis crispa FD-325 SS-3]
MLSYQPGAAVHYGGCMDLSQVVCSCCVHLMFLNKSTCPPSYTAAYHLAVSIARGVRGVVPTINRPQPWLCSGALWRLLVFLRRSLFSHSSVVSHSSIKLQASVELQASIELQSSIELQALIDLLAFSKSRALRTRRPTPPHAIPPSRSLGKCAAFSRRSIEAEYELCSGASWGLRGVSSSSVLATSILRITSIHCASPSNSLAVHRHIPLHGMPPSRSCGKCAAFPRRSIVIEHESCSGALRCLHSLAMIHLLTAVSLYPQLLQRPASHCTHPIMFGCYLDNGYRCAQLLAASPCELILPTVIVLHGQHMLRHARNTRLTPLHAHRPPRPF